MKWKKNYTDDVFKLNLVLGYFLIINFCNIIIITTQLVWLSYVVKSDYFIIFWYSFFLFFMEILLHHKIHNKWTTWVQKINFFINCSGSYLQKKVVEMILKRRYVLKTIYTSATCVNTDGWGEGFILSLGMLSTMWIERHGFLWVVMTLSHTCDQLWKGPSKS